MEHSSADPPHDSTANRDNLSLRSLVLAPLQPLLQRALNHAAADHPDIMERLGRHRTTRFLIDPVDLPFTMLLRPMPGALVLKACLRSELPAHDACIAGKLMQLVRLIDCDEDGDAMFFSRGLAISGDIEAVVTLRNALDDVEGSMAACVADAFGSPGWIALRLVRLAGGWRHREQRIT